MTELESLIDELYGLPPARFTDERIRLAKALKADGDDEAARRVGALRKPVVSAWALNLLTRKDPSGLDALESTGRRLREAQDRAISAGDADALRDATQERHATVSRLTRAALGILEREGVVGGSHGEDISTTLDAAAVDPEAFDALRRGRLTRPLMPPVGFGEGASLKVLPGARGRAPGPPEAVDPAKHRVEIGTLRRELTRAEGDSQKASRTVERARDRLETAERERSSAREDLREAEAHARGASLEVKRLARELGKIDPGAGD